MTSEKRTDRRAGRTRLALSQAVMKVAPRKGFDAMSVEDLAAEANVGRSTFYAHYAGKHDFLIECWRGMVGMCARSGKEVATDSKILPSRAYLHHVAGAGDFARSLLRSQSYAAARGARIEHLSSLAAQSLTTLHPDLDAVARRDIAVMLASALEGLVEAWVASGLHGTADAKADGLELLTRAALSQRS
jgi:AcrR family transcriptional regulator